MSFTIVPVRELFEKERYFNILKLVMASGMFPVILFPLRSRKVSWVKLPMASGMLPVKLFQRRPRKVSWVKLAIALGMLPVRWLRSRSKKESGRRNILLGREPDSKLKLRSRYRRNLRCRNSGGILPVKLLLKRIKLFSKERLPREGERVPSSPDPRRSMAATLLLCFLQRIPYQEHMFTEFWAVQLDNNPCGSAVMALLKVKRASRSVAMDDITSSNMRSFISESEWGRREANWPAMRSYRYWWSVPFSQWWWWVLEDGFQLSA